MANNSSKIERFMKYVKDNKAKWVSLRFTDMRGKEHHITLPINKVGADMFKNGKAFDGSSIINWKPINDSDMLMIPIAESAIMDPFREEPTVNVRCNIVEPESREAYLRDPRGVALKAEEYLRKLGIGSDAMFSCEPEFFIFDDIRWHVDMAGCFYEIDSEEAAWNSGTEYEQGNLGHRVGVKGGYMPVSPVDSSADLRTAMSHTMESMGLGPEVHHHEVGTAGQVEIGFGVNTLCRKADEIMIFKYCIHNVAHAYGKTATFIPKPLVGDNGSGMHCHQSIMKGGKNIFAGKEYGNLSKLALYYTGGILKHAQAINAFANAATNSYKRLVPGYEAPTILTYSAKNRSAAVRIPYSSKEKERRIETRFPDAAGNPYLTLSAQLMAGLDGIKNKIDPGEHIDKDLYEISAAEDRKYKHVCTSLEGALDALEKDSDFLKVGDVFSDDLIDAYIDMKRAEVRRLNSSTHPVEFDMYYSI